MEEVVFHAREDTLSVSTVGGKKKARDDPKLINQFLSTLLNFTSL